MIMAGGAGTRLWPMSRKSQPKQLLPFINGKSLLALAAERLDGVVPQANQYICTGEQYRSAIRQSLPQFDDEHIIGEPVGRDTLNAVGLTAAILAERDPDAVFVVLTADHLIEPVEAMRNKLIIGLDTVEQDRKRFVTYSITSTFAAEQYGWVKRGEAIDANNGVYHAAWFDEKPGPAKAAQYHADETINWNSGMFVFPAKTFLDAVQWFKPEAHPGLITIGKNWDAKHRQTAFNDIYPVQPKISVDHGVMNPASRDERIDVCTISLDVSWLDVGSWTSYAETLKPDAQNNRANTKLTQIDSTGVVAVSDDPKHTIATIGCADLIIIHTKDATLICKRDDAQKVKQLADMVDEQLR